MVKKYWKVYCGSNGKTYNFKNENKARDLYTQMIMRNFHTKIILVENKVEKVLDEFI